MQPNKMVFFNYEKREVVGEIEEKEFRCDMEKISPEFDHFLKEVKRVDGKDVMVDCRLVERRKLVMHLWKKSQMEKRFGERMVR